VVSELKQMRDFQKETIKKLESGHSPLIFAPTGIGKTKAALIPFIGSITNRGILGTRLIYALPMRSLMKSVLNEFESCTKDDGFTFQNNIWTKDGYGLRAVMHHGEQPESNIFSERACITTIDQVFTAFAGAPLSFSASSGHAVAGALHTSYLVFDEAHLLSGRYGLPMLFALLKLRKRWGLLSTVMTATLPDTVINFFCEYCAMEKVEASDNDIHERDSWRKVALDTSRKNSDITDVVYSLYARDQQRIIVFVNTVERAVRLYRDLVRLFEEKSLDKNRLLLAHSRFTTQHRKAIEEKLVERFDKESNFNGILITTQVAEAGLNISANTVVSELCPMDSLIQRAGRCARFKSTSGELQGHFYIIKPNDGNSWFLPYERTAMEQTERRLNFKTLTLSWQQEKQLVNDALGLLYESYLTGSYFEEGVSEEDDSNEE
jgi:CRISPR-associated endonuclease/helicase Cas3